MEFIPCQLLHWGNLVSHLGFSETAMSELPFRMQSAQSTEGEHSLPHLLLSMTVLLALVFCQGLIFFKVEDKPGFYQG